MKKGENQRLIRDINLNLVLNQLKMKDASVTDLAQRLNLSNTAVTKIINELLSLNMVVEGEPVVSPVAGRRKINYKYNADFGVVAVVNYAQKEIVITDMKGLIIEFVSLERIKSINLPYIKKTIDCLKGLNYPLASICIVTTGKVNPQTYEFIYALYVEDYPSINLHALFSEEFTCPIIVKNDISLGLIGEQKVDQLIGENQNGIYVYIGESIASSLCINGQLYEGSRGFAGEIGLFSSESYERLEDVVSVKALQEQLNLPFESIIRLYQEEESNVLDVIQRMTCYLAIVLKNATEFLDLDIIILSGEITKLGSKFIKKIKEFMKNYSYLNVEVIASNLQEKAIIHGAVEVAIEEAIQESLKNRR